MDQKVTIEDRVSSRYESLSGQLRAAADYVVENPVDIATRSLRSIAASSGLTPPTFSRLVRALDFESYEEMRELCRDTISRQTVSFSERVERLQSEEAGDGVHDAFLLRQSAASVTSIEKQANSLDADKLDAAVDAIHQARQVILVGALASAGIAEYFAYLGRWISERWLMVGRNGISLGPALAQATSEDVMIVITMSPFGKRSMSAARIAAEKGVYLIIITDRHSCPALKQANAGFIVPTESPQFFSSYVSTVVLIESIMGMLVKRAGEKAGTRIQEVENNNHRLEEYWAL